ncbi:MAG: hypothetical protein U1F65_10310 [Verrucomicrobiota bacterium]
MNTWKVILATLVIFGAGVITGGLMVNYSHSVEMPAQKRLGESGRRYGTNYALLARSNRPLLAASFLQRKDFLERLARDLKLNAVQRERIEKIISEGQDNIKELCQQIEPDVKEELAYTRERILDELSATQQDLFTELLKKKSAPRPAANSPAVLTNSSPAK